MDNIERAMWTKGLTDDEKIIFDLACKLQGDPKTANQAALLWAVLAGMESSQLLEMILISITPAMRIAEIILESIADQDARNN